MHPHQQLAMVPHMSHGTRTGAHAESMRAGAAALHMFRKVVCMPNAWAICECLIFQFPANPWHGHGTWRVAVLVAIAHRGCTCGRAVMATKLFGIQLDLTSASCYFPAVASPFRSLITMWSVCTFQVPLPRRCRP